MVDLGQNLGASRRSVMLGLPLIAAAAAVPAEAAESFWTAEYQAKKGAIALYLYRKRLTAPQAGEPPLPVLFLVHGSSVSSRPSFDLSVPGAGEYSLMNVFARAGFDVWTMDFDGYGRSGSSGVSSDIHEGVEDLRIGTDLVTRETAVNKLHFMGESSGALRAAAFAMVEPARVDRLVLEAFTYTGKGSPTLGKRAEQLDYYRTHTRRPRGEDMLLSIFTRDKPGTSDQRVAQALAAAEMPFGDSVPTGTYLDMTANLPVIDPAQLQVPVLVVRGQYDGIASEADLLDFFSKLPNPDKQYAQIAGAAHAITLSLNREGLWHVMQAFLTMPKTVQV
jgi:alpha-beta hydrolase superfamily lysophospholipase